MSTLVHDPDVHKLGKLDAKPPRAMIADHVDIERVLSAAPAIVDNSANRSIALAMYLNDGEGDCTIAGAGNTLRVNSKGAKQITDADVQSGYVAVTAKENGGQGYDPATGANDNGCVELDVLDYWVTVGIGGDRLLGHAGVNMTDLDEVRAVAWLFGSVYLGAALTVAQQSQPVWDYVTGSAPWGGHCPPIFDIDPQGGWLGTWGAYKRYTNAWLLNQADEGHALVTQSWLDTNVANPLVNATALAANLAALTPEN